MASPSIGGVMMPDFFDRADCGGSFRFHRQPQRLSGAGIAFSCGEQWAEWDWDALTISEFNWLRTQWQTGPTAFELWSDDEKATAVAFTSGAMLEPRHGPRLGAEYFADVHVEFRMLMPLQS